MITMMIGLQQLQRNNFAFVAREGICAKVILSRIRPTLLAHRRPQQSGFTPGRSTCDRIVTLNNIAQRRQDYVYSTYAAYVDLRAAFDSLSRSSLWLLAVNQAWDPTQDSQFDQGSIQQLCQLCPCITI